MLVLSLSSLQCERDGFGRQDWSLWEMLLFFALGECVGSWLRSPVEKNQRLVNKRDWFLIAMREASC